MGSIFLVGPMGAGKTTVGRALARRIGYRFFDSDREIECRCGVDIPTIFDYEGEEGFRQREARIIDELTAERNIVLATGGGAILREENRKVLNTRGYVVLLSVEIGEQLRRVALDTQRPLLRSTDPEARLRALMKERAGLYRSVAHAEVSTDARRLHHVVTRLLHHLRREQVIERPATKRAGARTSAKPAS